VDGVTHDWQVVFYLEEVKEVMEINVESSRADVQTLRQEILHQMEQQYPNLVKNLALGIFELRIDIHEAGNYSQKRQAKAADRSTTLRACRTPDEEATAPLVDQLI